MWREPAPVLGIIFANGETMSYDKKLLELLPRINGCPGKPACDCETIICAGHRDIYAVLDRQAAEHKIEAEELWRHLRYVWMLAGRLSLPAGMLKAEAIALTKGTLRAAENVLEKYKGRAQ